MTKIIAMPRRYVALVAALGLALGLLMAWSALGRTEAFAAAPGNNGTLKIHEQGTPSGTEDNDPKVCVFNVEGFGFDVAQTGMLSFTVQGGDGPQGTPAGPYSFGPTDASGFYATQYFTLDPGHYLATLTAPDGTTKAKSKVFKVTCELSPSPSPSISESASPSPSVSESASPSPSVSESASPSVAPSGASGGNLPPAVLPATAARGTTTPGAPGDMLATTGARLAWFTLFGVVLVIGGFVLMRAFRREHSA